MAHRGPDDSGTSRWPTPGGGEAALGAVRLAILDLSPAGHMPMESTDGRFAVTYNGEITNYVEIRDVLVAEGATFVSHTDTEVLLQAWQRWGVAALDRFEGMYAFAILDRHEGTLTLARDVFGIKPLFYSSAAEGAFAFASEIPALLALVPGRPRLDWQTAIDYLQWGAYDHAVGTFVEGISRLMPAHYVVLDLASGSLSEPTRYWWPSIATDARRSPSDEADEIRERFIKSIRNNLRSDVPVGIALSGGIDSSAIACAVRAIEPDFPLQTFSFVTPGFAESEEKWIDIVVKQTGAQAHFTSATGADLQRDLDTMIAAQGEPFGSTSIYAQFRVFQLVRERGVVVTLDGQGADEVFAGYSGYPAQRLHSLLERGRFVAAAQFLAAWGRWPDRSVRQAARDGASLALPRALVRRMSAMRPVSSRIYDLDVLRERGADPAFPALAVDSPRGSRLKSHLRAEMTSRGLPALLRHGDRNSMHFSIESRVPFLDRALVESTLRLPEDQLVGKDGASKAILRRAMRGLVPDAILDRRDKIGFSTPERHWLSEMDRSDHRAAEQLGFLRRTSDGAALVDGVDASELGMTSREQWRLLNLRRWAQVFDIDIA